MHPKVLVQAPSHPDGNLASDAAAREKVMAITDNCIYYNHLTIVTGVRHQVVSPALTYDDNREDHMRYPMIGCGIAVLLAAGAPTAGAQAAHHRRAIRDRTEDVRDRREDVRDRREDRRDRREDRLDRREDRWDARHHGGYWDRMEDRWDRREDIRDRREDVRDRREDVRDRREDRRDRRRHPARS